MLALGQVGQLVAQSGMGRNEVSSDASNAIFVNPGEGEDYQLHLVYQPAPSNLTQAWLNFLANMSTPPTDYVDKFGWKTIRLGFQFTNLNTSGPDTNLSLITMDTVISLLASRGYNVVLDDIDWSGFGSHTWVEDWLNVTKHYKGNTHIAAFEIFNEPTCDNGPGTPGCTWSSNVTTVQYNSSSGVLAAYHNATVAIHGIDPNRWVAISPLWFQDKLDPNYTDPEVYYDFHIYAHEGGQTYGSSIRGLLNFKNEYNVPVVSLELNVEGSKGINLTQTVYDINTLEYYGIPWIAWLYSTYPSYWIPVLDNASGISGTTSSSSSTTSSRSTISTSTSTDSFSSISSSSSFSFGNSSTSEKSLTTSSSVSSIQNINTSESNSSPNGLTNSGSKTEIQTSNDSLNSHYSSSSTNFSSLGSFKANTSQPVRGLLGMDQRKINAVTYGASTSIAIVAIGSAVVVFSSHRGARKV